MSSSEASRSIAWLRASSSAVNARRSFNVEATVTSRSAACSASLACVLFFCSIALFLPDSGAPGGYRTTWMTSYRDPPTSITSRGAIRCEPGPSSERFSRGALLPPKRAR